jgi:integrase
MNTATPVTVAKRCACVWTKCACEWQFNFRVNGVRQRGSLLRETGENPATRTAAMTAAEAIRAACLADTYVWARDRRRLARAVATSPVQTDPTPAAPTLDDLIAQFDARVITPAAIAATTKVSDRGILKRFRAYDPDGLGPIGTRPVMTLTEDGLEAFFIWLETERQPTNHTWNKYVTQIKKLCKWATRKDYVVKNPITGESILIRRRKGIARHQRVPERLADKVIAAAQETGTLLPQVIVALIETGLRIGELLALQWRDIVDECFIIAAREAGARKTGRRTVPISQVLWPLLDSLRCDATGDEFPPQAYIFGHEGGKIGSLRQAWETAVLKAHGHTITWTVTNDLDTASRRALQSIDLHIHDLRHEAGHRWLAQGWSLNEIQAMYGHATLTQTSTYLGIDTANLKGAMARADSRRFGADRESWSHLGHKSDTAAPAGAATARGRQALKLVSSGG